MGAIYRGKAENLYLKSVFSHQYEFHFTMVLCMVLPNWLPSILHLFLENSVQGLGLDCFTAVEHIYKQFVGLLAS